MGISVPFMTAALYSIGIIKMLFNFLHGVSSSSQTPQSDFVKFTTKNIDVETAMMATTPFYDEYDNELSQFDKYTIFLIKKLPLPDIIVGLIGVLLASVFLHYSDINGDATPNLDAIFGLYVLFVGVYLIIRMYITEEAVGNYYSRID